MNTDLEISNCPFCDATANVDFNEFGDRCTKYYRVKCAGEERHALARSHSRLVAIEYPRHGIY